MDLKNKNLCYEQSLNYTHLLHVPNMIIQIPI